MTSSSAPDTQTQGKKAKGGDVKEELDIHYLMDDMKKDIIQTYRIIDDPSQLEGKEVIEVLQVSFKNIIIISLLFLSL